MPAGFPNVELRHRFSVQGQASGSVFLDNVFFVEFPATNDSRWREVLGFGQRWKYFTETPPANWAEPDFNDAGWPEGIAKFGAGSGPQNIRTSIVGAKPAYYFRKTITMGSTNFSTLLLAATCTDDYGGVVYPLRLFVNGIEVISSGIEAVTGEGNLVKHFDITPFAGLFRADATNTIAVMLQNTWASDWDNVAFDVSLKGIAAAPPSVPEFRSIELASGGLITMKMIGPANTTWRLEAFDGSGSWDFVQAVTFDGNGNATVTVSQVSSGSRLFRLLMM